MRTITLILALLPLLVAVSLEKKNRFRVQVWIGQVTFYLNGVKVCQDYAPEWFLKSKPPVPFQ